MLKRKIKTIIIGPVYPYKGGIAHYTSLLYRALSQEYSVEVVSFKFQYPKFLYPGAEQKNFENDSFEIPGTQFLVHSMNPFNWVNAACKISKMNPDLVIFMWWNPFFAPAFTAIARQLKRKIKCKTLAICHNTLPHERILFDKLLAKSFFNSMDYFIVHSREDEKILLTLKPEAHYRRTVHPTYNVFRFEDITKAEARKEISLDSNQEVLLFFGFIRKYKGLITLINAIPEIVSHFENVILLIVGDFYSDKQIYLDRIKELKVGKHIKIIDGYIPDKEVGQYFSACDIVVLPYKSATQSGIIQIAYGFEKPVITTNVGGLAEVVLNDKTGFIVPPDNENELAKAVINFFNNNLEEKFINNIKRDTEKYSWKRMVEIINQLMDVN